MTIGWVDPAERRAVDWNPTPSRETSKTWTGTSPTVPAVTPTMPLIMTFSVDELITLMGKAQFTDTLIARRNLAVHGKMG